MDLPLYQWIFLAWWMITVWGGHGELALAVAVPASPLPGRRGGLVAFNGSWHPARSTEKTPPPSPARDQTVSMTIPRPRSEPWDEEDPLRTDILASDCWDRSRSVCLRYPGFALVSSCLSLDGNGHCCTDRFVRIGAGWDECGGGSAGRWRADAGVADAPCLVLEFVSWMLQDLDPLQIQAFTTTWYSRACPRQPDPGHPAAGSAAGRGRSVNGQHHLPEDGQLISSLADSSWHVRSHSPQHRLPR
jgi:hypothetical protein